MPTHEQRLLDSIHYDAATGAMTWAKPPRRGVPSGSVAGCKTERGYLSVGFEGQAYYAHRLAWRIAHGLWPSAHIDHINGDPSDNRLCNLRDVPRHVNLQNMRKATKRSKSGILGVKCSGDRFAAGIRVNGATRHIGSFDTAEEASAAYVNAKRALHAGCTI